MERRGAREIEEKVESRQRRRTRIKKGSGRIGGSGLQDTKHVTKEEVIRNKRRGRSEH